MVCFQKLFIESTDPESHFSRILHLDVVISVITHVVLYVLFVCLFTCIFDIKLSKSNYLKLTIALIIIMILGYFGRLARSKSLYGAFINRGEQPDVARTKTLDLMYSGYFTHYFLG